MKIKQLGLFALLFAQAGLAQTTDEKLVAKAKKIHERVITIDTHNDINVNNFTHDHNYTQDLDTQVNLPKMDKGDLDVSWLIVYTGQGDLDDEAYKKAYENAISKFEAIHRLTEEIAPDKIGLATTSKEVRKLVKQGKKVAMIGVENGYPIGTDIKNVEKFYDMGARYMSLAHNGHSQLSDSNTGEADGEWLNNGLSDLGKEVIKEMNRLGIMIDVSHPSKEAIKQMFELSEAPLIASHSSARALCDHSRNLDDELLALFDKHGGVIQTVAFSSYVNTEKHEAFNAAKTKVYEAKAKELGFEILSWGEVRELEEDEREAYIANYKKLVADAENEVDAIKETISPVDVSDFVDHIDYLVEKVGIDQVGISSDFDGGGGIDGWNDASESFNVTLELVKRGYTEKEIAKLWGENLLRVLDEVEAVAKKIQKA
ncbi:dipeptidase [Zunongwangia profunda]|uniref:Membrane dipeptidase n=1 Tax=Zunongwangia profunda (strain DSM 18752 / CCTCC AB 206139 / SM-A87) TaxID=655815 RepID=D5BEC7_ZUNPS|nr:membrane dipeptidase [Zunongwangia profunda]ADF52886.1 membrane dipeptidase [Zunongwangia profunda SM-A87]MAS72744.1 peptidase M19 [Zunongwangia sp.]|tara:strand:+ start:657 stop:1943 length:1287 start_codon:yes stop_codon:yes gene_type:complete